MNFTGDIKHDIDYMFEDGSQGRINKEFMRRYPDQVNEYIEYLKEISRNLFTQLLTKEK